MLTLPIKKKWFDMILSGEKKEEYREIKPYWEKRLEKHFNLCQRCEYWGCNILLRNGYNSKSRILKCLVAVDKGYGKKEWGATLGKRYYVLKILSVEVIK